MEDAAKIISMSLPIIFVIKNGGKTTLNDLSQGLNGWGMEFRNVKSVDKFVRREISCLDYDGVNLKYNRFSKQFVKNQESNSSVQSFLDSYLEGYSNWKLYTVSEN